LDDGEEEEEKEEEAAAVCVCVGGGCRLASNLCGWCGFTALSPECHEEDDGHRTDEKVVELWCKRICATGA
jgi:hypothetical protein